MATYKLDKLMNGGRLNGNEEILAEKFGNDSTVHLDLGSLDADRKDIGIEEFLAGRGLSIQDFPGKKLELVPVENLSIYWDYSASSVSGKSPAKSLLVLVSS